MAISSSSSQSPSSFKSLENAAAALSESHSLGDEQNPCPLIALATPLLRKQTKSPSTSSSYCNDNITNGSQQPIAAIASLAANTNGGIGEDNGNGPSGGSGNGTRKKGGKKRRNSNEDDDSVAVSEGFGASGAASIDTSARNKPSHKCPDCEKTFARKSFVERHRRLKHLQSRPFPCPTCTASFARTDLLGRHRKICPGLKDKGKTKVTGDEKQQEEGVETSLENEALPSGSGSARGTNTAATAAPKGPRTKKRRTVGRDDVAGSPSNSNLTESSNPAGSSRSSPDATVAASGTKRKRGRPVAKGDTKTSTSRTGGADGNDGNDGNGMNVDGVIGSSQAQDHPPLWKFTDDGSVGINADVLLAPHHTMTDAFPSFNINQSNNLLASSDTFFGGGAGAGNFNYGALNPSWISALAEVTTPAGLASTGFQDPLAFLNSVGDFGSWNSNGLGLAVSTMTGGDRDDGGCDPEHGTDDNSSGSSPPESRHWAQPLQKNDSSVNSLLNGLGLGGPDVNMSSAAEFNERDYSGISSNRLAEGEGMDLGGLFALNNSLMGTATGDHANGFLEQLLGMNNAAIDDNTNNNKNKKTSRSTDISPESILQGLNGTSPSGATTSPESKSSTSPFQIPTTFENWTANQQQQQTPGPGSISATDFINQLLFAPFPTPNRPTGERSEYIQRSPGLEKLSEAEGHEGPAENPIRTQIPRPAGGSSQRQDISGEQRHRPPRGKGRVGVRHPNAPSSSSPESFSHGPSPPSPPRSQSPLLSEAVSPSVPPSVTENFPFNTYSYLGYLGLLKDPNQRKLVREALRQFATQLPDRNAQGKKLRTTKEGFVYYGDEGEEANQSPGGGDETAVASYADNRWEEMDDFNLVEEADRQELSMQRLKQPRTIPPIAYVGGDSSRVSSSKTYIPFETFTRSYCFHEHDWPTRPTLCRYAHNAFSSFLPHIPLIHAPSLKVSESHIHLVYTLCVTGSLYEGTPEARRFGEGTLAQKRPHIMGDFMNTNNPFSARFAALQSFLTFQLMSWASKDTGQRNLGLTFHGCLITMMRQLNLVNLLRDSRTLASMGPDAGDKGPIFLSGFAMPITVDPVEKERNKRWRNWVFVETARRVLFLIYLADLEYAIQCDTNPLLGVGEIDSDLACRESLWKAPDSLAWAKEETKWSNRPVHFHVALRCLLSDDEGENAIPSLGNFSELVLLRTFVYLRQAMKACHKDNRPYPFSLQTIGLATNSPMEILGKVDRAIERLSSINSSVGASVARGGDDWLERMAPNGAWLNKPAEVTSAEVCTSADKLLNSK